MPLAPPSFPPRMTRYPRSTLDEASAPARRRVAAADSSSAPYERREPGSAVLLARSPYPNRIVPNECFTRSRNHERGCTSECRWSARSDKATRRDREPRRPGSGTRDRRGSRWPCRRRRRSRAARSRTTCPCSRRQRPAPSISGGVHQVPIAGAPRSTISMIRPTLPAASPSQAASSSRS